MDVKQKTIVFLILLTANILTPTVAGQTAGQSRNKLPPQTAEAVVLDVTVTDRTGGSLMGLKSADFEVTIDKKPAQIVSLNQADSPVSVGILLDSSGSASQQSSEQTAKTFLTLRDAIRHFIESSNPANDYFLLAFNTKPQLLADWTSDSAAIVDKFYGFRVSGNTALYDACYVGVNKLNGGRHEKHALILVSDGMDNLSHYTFKELRDLLRETNVLLYSINFQSVRGQGMLGEEGASILDQLSFISGGKTFSDVDGAPLMLKHANAVFEIIATELRNQYTLSIVPNEPLAPKKWHKIKVKLNLSRSGQSRVKGLSVRTREGFYSR